jgi:hypothetical protein
MRSNDDRRRYPRVPLITCVTLSSRGEEIGIFRVLNLSAGGALLEGSCPGVIGQQLTARLHFSPFEVVVGAVVVRDDADGHSARFALNFELMSPEARECVQSLVLAVQEAVGTGSAPMPRERAATPDQVLYAQHQRPGGAGCPPSCVFFDK